MSYVWHPLVREIYNSAKDSGLEKSIFVVGLSGGLDSVALLSVVVEISRVLRSEVIAVNIHHGVGFNDEFRSSSQTLCREICQRFGVYYLSFELLSDGSAIQASESLGPQQNGLSEGLLRDLRRKVFGAICECLENFVDLDEALTYVPKSLKNLGKVNIFLFKKSSSVASFPVASLPNKSSSVARISDHEKMAGIGSVPQKAVEKKAGSLSQLKPILVLGHHLDDLLETRLMRLIRGSGIAGLEAMTAFKNNTWRPFIKKTKSELRAYLEQKQITWIEDPTNSDPQLTMRNWIRHTWLPQLESQYPGSTHRIALSLQLITDSVAVVTDNLHELASQDPLPLTTWNRLSLVEQSQIISIQLNKLGKKNYSSGLIDEIIKVLRQPKNEIKHQIGQWTILKNSQGIKINYKKN